VSGSWFTPLRSPWPAPFPPPSPPIPWGDLCSKASSVLCSCPTPCTRASRSCPVGSPCGPGDRSSGQRQGLPGSAHSVSTHARGLRPRRVRLRLARTASTVLPSACSERVGTRKKAPISGLNTLPACSPVNASPTPLPMPAHDSGPVWLAGPSLSGTCTLHHCAGLSRRLPERWRSPAAGSGSDAGADAVSSQVQCLVRRLRRCAAA